MYIQEHLNRIWDRAAGVAPVGVPIPRSPLPSAP
jgi:hypothetical protein